MTCDDPYNRTLVLEQCAGLGISDDDIHCARISASDCIDSTLLDGELWRIIHYNKTASSNNTKLYGLPLYPSIDLRRPRRSGTVSACTVHDSMQHKQPWPKQHGHTPPLPFTNDATATYPQLSNRHIAPAMTLARPCHQSR
eukprot:scaffold43600_cov36-Cyclotella_meneghiniana.AAC.1